MSQRRVILLTGATGFVGSRLAKGLLEQGHTVLVLLRPKARSKGGRPIPMASRAAELKRSLKLDSASMRRLIPVQGDLASLSPRDLSRRLTQATQRLGQPPVLHGVLHAAARLQMDHPHLSEAQREATRRSNERTNVMGLKQLLQALKLFSPAQFWPSPRILRPSNIAGPGSKDAYMAFLHYLNQSFMGMQLSGVGSRLVGRLPRGGVVPLPGNPRVTLDIVDVSDVVRATLALLSLDLQVCTAEGTSPGRFLLMSTAYAHGAAQGLQLERALGPAEALRHRNSYESIKTKAEAVLADWAQEPARYNHLCGTAPPTLSRVAECTLAGIGRSKTAIQRIAFRTPGEDVENAMRGLRLASPLTYKIADGLWRAVPMLLAYLNRPTGVSFDTRHTSADLAKMKLRYAPRAFNRAYVRALVASLS